MLVIRSSLRSTSTSPLLRRFSRAISSTVRPHASKVLERWQLEASGPVAEELAATGVWVGPRRGPKPKNEKSSKSKSKSKPKVKGDKARLNVVSEKLCDDIISYIGPSLERHKGCDILDIYPGAGLWSRKLHEFLQPRSHILMEPDSELYEPFLKPLLDQPNTTLVPASGIVWRELNPILTPEYLPHQAIPDRTQIAQRNDTLLVTANLSFHPKKKFLSFESIASLVLYQFLGSIRTSDLFQRYGLVRMLIWTRNDDTHGLIPKIMQQRRKLALEGELSCEWVREVCGPELGVSWFARDNVMDASSTLAAWEKMMAAGITVPLGRASAALKEAQLAFAANKTITPGSTPPVYKRAFQEKLEELEIAYEDDAFSNDSDLYSNMKAYQWRANWEGKKHNTMLELLSGLDTINAIYKSGKSSPGEIEKLEAEWVSKLLSHPNGFIGEFVTYKDNLHHYRQDPPTLHWDRRAYDPLLVQPEEFFPNIDCKLLDIQPKAVHPLLRQTGPKSNRAGDCFDLIMTSMLGQSTLPMGQALDAIMPGAADYIIPRWKSAKDVDRGGVITTSRYAELTPRMLNARQWEELLELWMEWPFRPEFHELIARTQDDPGDEDSILPSEA